MFLGLANENLNKNDESEKAYVAATRIKPTDRMAWQGLISLYEKQQGQKLDAYREVVLTLGQVFAEGYVIKPIGVQLRGGADIRAEKNSSVAKTWSTNTPN